MRRAGRGRRYTALVILFFLPVGWMGLGAWLLTAGLGLHGKVEPVAGWPHTTGRIVSFHTYLPSYSRTPTYPAVIAFRAAGRLVTFSAPGLTVPPTLGAAVRVAYNPRNPADAHDLSLGSDGEGQIYLGIGILVSGVALLAFLYWLVFVRQKSARRPMAQTTFSGGRHVRND